MEEEKTLQEQFEELTQQKINLWEQIKGNVIYWLTDEWKQIGQLDIRLLELRAQIEGGQ